MDALQAAFDFNTVLTLGHDSADLRKLLQQAMDKYLDSEGTVLDLNDHSVSSVVESIPFAVVSDMEHLVVPSVAYTFCEEGSLKSNDSEFVRILIEESDDEDLTHIEESPSMARTQTSETGSSSFEKAQKHFEQQV